MQTLFGKHLRKHPPKESEVYELKFTSGNSISFNALKEHQREALKNAQRGGFYHKIVDQPVFYGKKTRFHHKKPFDCFFVKCRAYVVIWFYKPRKPKRFYKINIYDFLLMEGLARRKSFTEDMAKRHCTDFIDII